MTTEIVVELVIDSSPAVSGANAYVVSMDLAAAAADKLVGQTQKVDDAIAKQAGGVTRSTERIGAYKTAYERLVTSVDPAARAHAAYERAVKTSENAVRRGITTNEEAARTLDLLQKKLLGISDTPPIPASPEVPEVGKQAGLAAHQLSNLSFQMQDVGQAVLTGQPIFRTLIQQGSQIVQIFSPGTGVGGAIKGAGTALLAFVTNPLNLAVLGFAALAAGAQALVGWLFKATDSTEAAEAANDRLADTIGTLRDVYGETRIAVDELTKAEATRLALQTQIDLNAARADLERRQADLTRVTNVDGDIGLNMMLADPGQGPERLAIDTAVQAFLQTVRDGEPNVIAFREAMERISLASDSQRVDEFAQAILDVITPVAEVEDKVADLAAVMVILTDAQGEGAEAARRQLGLATALDLALERQAGRIADVGRAYGQAAGAVARSAVELFEFRRDAAVVAEGLVTEARAAVAAIMSVMTSTDLTGFSANALAMIQAAWQAFYTSIGQGTPDVIAFREALAALANLDPENGALQGLVDSILALTAVAAEVQAPADAAAAAIKGMGDVAAATKSPVDSFTAAVQQLKAMAAGGVDLSLAKSLYEIGLAAATSGDQVLYLKNMYAELMGVTGGTAPGPLDKKLQPAAPSGGGGSAETISDFDQATEAITRQIRELELDAATFGLAADAAALFRVEMQLLDAALEDGIVTDAERGKIDELVAQFQAGQAALAELNAGAADADPWKAAKGYAESFVQSLVSGLGSGKTMLEAVEGAVGSLGSSLRQAAVKDLFAGNFGVGIIKGIVGLVAGFIARRMRERRELEAARDAWAEMSDELAAFADRLAGHGGGSLAQSIADATAEMQPYIEAAKAAKASTADLERMLEEFAVRASTVFMARFPQMIAALDAGLGNNSPAIAAAQNVAGIGEELKGFVADTKTAQDTLDGNRQAVRLAEEAAKSYALSLLRTPQVLSEVETEMLRIQGTAAELQSVLVDLGMSASEAAAAIGEGVAGAIGDLRSKFSKDLGAKINDAVGKGYLNEVSALVGEAAQLLSDATLLGMSGADVSTYFAAQAQAIVDGAGLTGAAFQELIGLFPQLAGVVHEASGSVEEAMDRINDAAAGVLDYVRGLLTGSSSTLSPEARLANAQSVYNSQIALAQGGDVEAQSKITDYADALLEAARTMFASSTGYQNIFARVTSELLGLPAVQATTDPSNVALRQSLGGAGPSTLAIAPSTSAALFSAGGATIPVPANDRGSDLGIRQNFVDLMQVTQGGANAQIVVLREQFEGLRGEVREVVRALSAQRDQPRRAGSRNRWQA